MKKKKFLLLTLIPMLLSLTGCQMGSPVYTSFKLTGNWGDWIQYSLWCLSADITQAIDKMAAGLKSLGISTILTVVNDEGTSSIQTLLGYNDGLVSLMNVISVLACAIIVIKFAYSIFKYNFQAADNQYAPTAIELIKKVLVALVLTFAIPYICVTGFTLSTKLGSAAAIQLTNTGEDENSLQNQIKQLALFDTMETYEISYQTVCKTEASKTPDDYIDKKTLPGSGETGFSGSENKSFWCGDAESVGDHFMNDKLSSELATVITSNTVSGENDEDTTTFMTTLKGFLGVFFYIALTIIVGWSVAKRIVDLIILIGMSWWYIGSSVSDGPTGTSIKALFNKLLSICLSQFTLLFFLGLLQAFGLLSDVSMAGLIRAIAWLAILAGVPTAVEGMVTSTGAGSDLSAIAGQAGKSVKGLMSKFRG